jgi:ABC-type nickel/cobalt efflux system permease component RcnA
MLVFPLPLSLLVLLLTLAEGYTMQGIIKSLVFAFLSGAFIFGILSLLIVVMSNRAAHIRQAWKARNGRS